jgi:hypothetical protein
MTNFWEWSETFSPASDCSIYLNVRVILSRAYVFAYGFLLWGKKAANIWK